MELDATWLSTNIALLKDAIADAVEIVTVSDFATGVAAATVTGDKV